MSRPTLLFVHGAWHSPSFHYAAFLETIEAAGFHTVAPALPTINGIKPPNKSLMDDVVLVKEIAAELVAQGRPVLVLCHSYGGVVVTNALTPDLSFTSRHNLGQPGGIVHVVYLCAFMPMLGGSVRSIFTDSGALLAFDIDGEGNSFPNNPHEAFYADVDPTEAKRMSDNLITHPAKAHGALTTAEAWRYFPVTYLYCEQDMAITIACQHEMVAAIEKGGAMKPVRTETFNASHSPFLSMPKDIVAAVQRAWNVSAERLKLAAV